MLSQNEHAQSIEALVTFLKENNIDPKAFKSKYPFFWLSEERKDYVRRRYFARLSVLLDSKTESLSTNEEKLYIFFGNIVRFIEDPENWLLTNVFELKELLTEEIYNVCKNKNEYKLPPFFNLIFGYDTSSISKLSQLHWCAKKAQHIVFGRDTTRKAYFINRMSQYYRQRDWYIGNCKYDLAIFENECQKKPLILINFSPVHSNISEALTMAKNSGISYCELFYDAKVDELFFPNAINTLQPVGIKRQMSTQDKVCPVIYMYTINDKRHQNLIKIGQTSIKINKVKNWKTLSDNDPILKAAAKKRINNQLKTAMIPYSLQYVSTAIQQYNVNNVSITMSFTDKEFHNYLSERYKQVKYQGNLSEWFEISLNDAVSELNNYKNLIKTNGNVREEYAAVLQFTESQCYEMFSSNDDVVKNFIETNNICRAEILSKNKALNL